MRIKLDDSRPPQWKDHAAFINLCTYAEDIVDVGSPRISPLQYVDNARLENIDEHKRFVWDSLVALNV